MNLELTVKVFFLFFNYLFFYSFIQKDVTEILYFELSYIWSKVLYVYN